VQPSSPPTAEAAEATYGRKQGHKALTFSSSRVQAAWQSRATLAVAAPQPAPGSASQHSRAVELLIDPSFYHGHAGGVAVARGAGGGGAPEPAAGAGAGGAQPAQGAAVGQPRPQRRARKVSVHPERAFSCAACSCWRVRHQRMTAPREDCRPRWRAVFRLPHTVLSAHIDFEGICILWNSLVGKHAPKSLFWDLHCRNGSIQQRMLAMLSSGQGGGPPTSLAEAAAVEHAAQGQQQQQQQQQGQGQQQQSGQQQSGQQQPGGGGSGFAHAQNSGFAELSLPSSQWAGAGGGPNSLNTAAAAAATRTTLSPGTLVAAAGMPASALLAPGTAAALGQMGSYQQLRFGAGGGDFPGGMLGAQPVLGGYTAAPAAAAVPGPAGQLLRVGSGPLQGSATGGAGFQRPKSSADGWQPLRPQGTDASGNSGGGGLPRLRQGDVDGGGGSTFGRPGAGSAFSPHEPRNGPGTPAGGRPGAGSLGPKVRETSLAAAPGYTHCSCHSSAVVLQDFGRQSVHCIVHISFNRPVAARRKLISRIGRKLVDDQYN